MCAKEKARFLDAYQEVFLSRPRKEWMALLSGGVHMSEKGYAAFAQYCFEKLFTTPGKRASAR